MSVIRIHPEFRLNEQSFVSADSFLIYVKEELPDSYSFLLAFLSDAKTILVNTSGSTGRPKRIFIAKKAMLASAEATGQFFSLTAKTKALHCLSSDYIAGKMMWVRALHLGWHLDVVLPDSNPLKCAKSNYDFAAMVPMQVENSIGDLYRIKKLIIGGAPLSIDTEQQLKDLPIQCYQTYGMTETITHIAIKSISDRKDNFYNCLPKVQVSKDSRDCLIIQAPRISFDRIITNDVVRLISNTEFEWLGRYDNVINSGGIKLFPEQIEAKLAAFIPKPFIIGALPDDKLGQKLVLLIESPSELLNLDKLLASATLSKYEFPKKTLYLSSFIRTENSKINRSDTFSLINQ